MLQQQRSSLVNTASATRFTELEGKLELEGRERRATSPRKKVVYCVYARQPVITYPLLTSNEERRFADNTFEKEKNPEMKPRKKNPESVQKVRRGIKTPQQNPTTTITTATERVQPCPQQSAPPQQKQQKKLCPSPPLPITGKRKQPKSKGMMMMMMRRRES